MSADELSDSCQPPFLPCQGAHICWRTEERASFEERREEVLTILDIWELVLPRVIHTKLPNRILSQSCMDGLCSRVSKVTFVDPAVADTSMPCLRFGAGRCLEWIPPGFI